MADSTYSVIEQKAFGIAATTFLLFDGELFNSNPFLGFLEYLSAIEEGRDPVDLNVRTVFEGCNDVRAEIEDLAAIITDDMSDTLRLAKCGLINETIECRVDGDFNNLDMSGLVDIGRDLESGSDKKVVAADHVPDEIDEIDDEEGVLRRYNIGVTRIGISSQQTIPVMATGLKDAEAMAVEIAGDRLFSEVDASYEVFASDADSVVIQDGDAVTWVDPEDGPAQPVVFRRTYGDIVLCHTQGGGEVEAFASELR